MDAGDRGLTANEVYDLTVADGINNGTIGSLAVSTCAECEPPQGMFFHFLTHKSGGG